MTIITNQASPEIRIYTHNVRYATPHPFKGEAYWKDRKQLVINSILFNVSVAPLTVVCLQEVLHNQLVDIMEGLGSDWAYKGVGRDDGKEDGEYNPIIYKKSQWTIINHETRWLSETPDKPSRGWDGGCNRMLNWVQFESASNSTIRVNIFNTHLDNSGKIARREGSKQILARYKEVVKEAPLILTGDFNSPPDDEAYQLVDQVLTDSYLTAPVKYGHFFTYTSFAGEDPESRIDFIWTSPKVNVARSGVLHSQFGDFMSDHRPVVSDVTI